MMVRCGACRNQFDVGGPGRYSCPTCGTVNAVRGATTPMPGQGPIPPGPTNQPGPTPMGPPPIPDTPSPRVICPECEFSFIVGNIAVATCPNCNHAVKTGFPQPDPAPNSATDNPLRATPDPEEGEGAAS